MPRLSLAFFTAAGCCGLCGMTLGAYMAAHNDFTLAPAHAHLNLLGWVTLSIMGGFYAFAGPRTPKWLGWGNFCLSFGGVLVIVPSLAMLLMGHKEAEKFVIAGTVITICGMLAFAAEVIHLWGRPKPAVAR